MNTTYVYENTEVRKTERVARRELGSGKCDTLYEITPVDPTFGSWKKWVRDIELYKIVDSPTKGLI